MHIVIHFVKEAAWVGQRGRILLIRRGTYLAFVIIVVFVRLELDGESTKAAAAASIDTTSQILGCMIRQEHFFFVYLKVNSEKY